MIFKRIIPSVLIYKKRLVKGNYKSNYKDAGNPVTTIRAYNFQGADEIIISNIDANFDEYTFKLLDNICYETNIPLTYFGGINSLEQANKLFKIGFDRIGINSHLFKNKSLIQELSQNYGSQAILAGVDLMKHKNEYKVINPKKNKFENINFLEWIMELYSLGAGEVRVLDTSSEGMENGIDKELLEILSKNIKYPFIFEGGISKLQDLAYIYDYVNAIGLGSMLVYSDYNIIKLKKYLKDKNIFVRV